MTQKNLRIGTKCIHSGYKPKNGEPRVQPLVQSTTYVYDTADYLGDLFDLKAEGHIYSRISNPTVDSLEKKIAELEGGVAAVATSSGQSAVLLAILTLCKKGDHIVALANLYGGTLNILSHTIKNLGIDVTFVEVNASDEVLQAAIKDNTKLVYGETIGNPRVDVLDIERIASLAHANNIPLVVDNTFASPVLCRPIEFGADIVVHSTTKYLDGHCRALGGILIDGGRFDWTSGKFPDLVNPDPSYHGLSYTDTFGPAAFATRARVTFVRDIGFIMAPFNAFLTDLGCETLALRMERHSSNALKIAKFLEEHDKVEWVNYPGLESSSTYELAKKYLPNGQSGVIAFGVKGGVEKAKNFIDGLELIPLVTHVADSKSCVIHPASTTHRQLSKEALEAGGITENLVRLSVGIEDVEDLIEDIKASLDKIK